MLFSSLSLVLLQGCSKASPKKVNISTISQNTLPASIHQEHSLGCIDELRSLTVLDPNNYDKLVSLFKEISKLNQTYKSVEYNAVPDSLVMMRMTIESKTKVLCAKVKYYSIISVDKKTGEVNVL